MNKNYVKATSENLPKVDLDMLLEFLSNQDCYLSVEMKGVKLSKAMRANYGDGAVGYVQLMRQNSNVIVESKICPEHKVRKKDYRVTVKIDEKNEVVKDAKCHDCAASEGGCKHAVALLAWIYRRSEEPSPTEIVCYWQKPKLSNVAAHIDYKKIKDIVESSDISNNNIDKSVVDNNFLLKVLSCQKEQNIENCHLLKFHESSAMKQLSMHFLSVCYTGDKNNCQEFLQSCEIHLVPENCTNVFNETLNQSENSTWHELRYGRITASIVYEASQCKKADGSLVEKIMGMSQFDTPAMERGRQLEPKVLEKVSSYLEVKIKKCGLILQKEYPAFGASPDGMSDDAVFEVKCPMKEKNIESYYKNNKITNKFKAQIQMQMLFASRSKSYFCIADPDFEKNGKVNVVVENFDKNFITALMKRAASFWKDTIFPILMK